MFWWNTVTAGKTGVTDEDQTKEVAQTYLTEVASAAVSTGGWIKAVTEGTDAPASIAGQLKGLVDLTGGGDPTGTAGAAIFLMSQVIGLCQMMGLDKKAVAAAKYAAAKAADQEYLTKAKDKFWAGTREAMTGANAMFGTISVDAFDIAQRADMESAVAELGFVERSPDVSYEETVGTLGPMYGRHSKNSVIQDAWSIKFNAGEATEIAVGGAYKARYEIAAKETAVGSGQNFLQDE